MFNPKRVGAKFLFQVIAERAERAAWIVTTNLPFSEWTQAFSKPRLRKALLDRITDWAYIIATGTGRDETWLFAGLATES